MFPSKFCPSTRVPSDFFYRYATFFEAFDFLIHDLHRFLHEVTFSGDFDLVKSNEKVFIRETFFRVTYMEGIVNFVQFLR